MISNTTNSNSLIELWLCSTHKMRKLRLTRELVGNPSWGEGPVLEGLRLAGRGGDAVFLGVQPSQFNPNALSLSALQWLVGLQVRSPSKWVFFVCSTTVSPLRGGGVYCGLLR